MKQSDMECIVIAAQFGTCNSRYLGEILDQIRMQGLTKHDIQWIGRILATESPDVVTRLQTNVNMDQFQRWMACVHGVAGNDLYMQALEYAFLVYGWKAGLCAEPDTDSKNTIVSQLSQAATNGELSISDMIQLAETFREFWAIFRTNLESYLDGVRVLEFNEETDSTVRIVALVTDFQCVPKSKKLNAMKWLRLKNVTPNSKNLERLQTYFSLREIRYLNAILADGKVSKAVQDRIDMEFAGNLLCSGDDPHQPYTASEQSLLAEICNRKFSKSVDGYTEMKDYIAHGDYLRQKPKFTNENWFILYEDIVKSKYQSSFGTFWELLAFDCTKSENRCRLAAMPDDDAISIIYRASQQALMKSDNDPHKAKEDLEKIMTTIDGLSEDHGEIADERQRLWNCIKYTGPCAAKFVQAGVIAITDPSEFKDYWQQVQRFEYLDTWTIRALIKCYGEDDAMPDNIAPYDPAEFFETIYLNRNEERFTQEERIRLFRMYAKGEFLHGPRSLCKVYEYMLRNQIAFDKFMDPQTSLSLVKLLMKNDDFRKEYGDELRSMILTDEEFQNYKRKKEDEEQRKENLVHLLRVQKLLRAHVHDLVYTPREFMKYSWRVEPGQRKFMAESIAFLKQMHIHLGEKDEPILEELFRAFMQGERADLCRYVERMNEIASTMQDPYFLEIMAKHVLKEMEEK